MYDVSGFDAGQYTASQSVGLAGPLLTVTEIVLSSRAIASDGGSSSHMATAAWAFNRPPVVVMPPSAATGSVDVSSMVFSWAVVFAHADSTSAAAPDTCG